MATQAKFKKVLVISKKSCFTVMTETNDRRNLDLVAAGDESVADVMPAHEAHTSAITKVEAALSAAKVEFTSVSREHLDSGLTEKDIAGYDLVVSVGGDGVVLNISHYAGRTPILAVNSNPGLSHGKYCPCNGDGFADYFAKVSDGTLTPLSLTRLRLIIDGKKMDTLALNEVLVRDADIGGIETCRYKITIGGVTESHKSSGVFIGTAAGSTAWMHSADSDVLHLNSRHFQYLVRELIKTPGNKLVLRRGVLEPTAQIEILSQMREGAVFVDGRHVVYPLLRGQKLIVRPSRLKLRLFSDADANRPYAQDMVPTLTGWTPKCALGPVGTWH